MSIETKPAEKAAKPPKLEPLYLPDSPVVKAAIKEHADANPQDVVFYTRLVNELPERAIETLILKDRQAFDKEMSYITKQMPLAKAFYDAQSPEGKARIDRQMEGVKPYYRDRAFVRLYWSESDRQAGRKSRAEQAQAMEAQAIAPKHNPPEPPVLAPASPANGAAIPPRLAA